MKIKLMEGNLAIYNLQSFIYKRCMDNVSVVLKIDKCYEEKVQCRSFKYTRK